MNLKSKKEFIAAQLNTSKLTPLQWDGIMRAMDAYAEHYHEVKSDDVEINYNIGDTLVSKDRPNHEIGICTGFRHNDTCVDINGECYGGKTYFMKSEEKLCRMNQNFICNCIDDSQCPNFK